MNNSEMLTRNTFAGDIDARRLRSFLCSEQQYDGDARWHGGTSLKAMWLSLYEFSNAQPVTEYWTTNPDVTAGMISVWPDRWRMQPGSQYRDEVNVKHFAQRADTLCAMLATEHEIKTYAYTSLEQQQLVLEWLGYHKGDRAEVFMACKLDHRPAGKLKPSGLTISRYDAADPAQRVARALIQADAFTNGQASDDMIAWHLRNIDRMNIYSADNIDFVASTDNGESVAFVSIQLDRVNNIAEIEPVGTRSSSQRQGIARQLLQHSLTHMKQEGIETAFIRTDVDNAAAIAAYESVGFEIQDYLFAYTRQL